MLIRAEKVEDRKAVFAVNTSAIESEDEARLVDALRQQAEPNISWVAQVAGDIVGHIMFSPVTLDGADGVQMMGLAPMAVLPENQGQGIGSALVRAGLQRCKEMGFEAVVVLGVLKGKSGRIKYHPAFSAEL